MNVSPHHTAAERYTFPMERVSYLVTGMSCDNCVKKVTAALSGIEGITAEVTLPPARAVLAGYLVPNLDELNERLAASGKYRLARNDLFKSFLQSLKRFLPLIIMFTLVILATTIVEMMRGFSMHRATMAFMGSYFLLFGLLKVLNWRGFAESYRQYDDIARNSELYAFLYPIIELSLGALFLLGIGMSATSFFTMLLMSQKAYSVSKQLARGGEVRCACLGGLFNIPVTHVTLVEDAMMALMAAVMLGMQLHGGGVPGAMLPPESLSSGMHM